MDLFADPLIQIAALPFLGALVIGGIILIVGRLGSGRRVAAAGAGISFAWVAGFTLGSPSFPPEPDLDSMIALITAALIFGVALDYYFGPARDRGDSGAFWELTLIILFGIGAPFWLRGTIDLWAPVIVLAWGFVAFRLRALSQHAVTPAVMLLMAAAGIGVVAWIGGLGADRDLAFGLAAAIGGFIVLGLIDQGLPFSATALLVFAGGILGLGVRVAETIGVLVPALILLGFIFFTDSLARRLSVGRMNRYRTGQIVFHGLAAVLPIALAAAAAAVALEISGP
ncbi:MAG: hypothetical protein HQ503_00205 [Rhodospirillales bacterium]|nr:hypothetical protein [Rhodospirillales bacterium]